MWNLELRVRGIFLFDLLIHAVELSRVATNMSVCEIGDNDKLLNLLIDLILNCFLHYQGYPVLPTLLAH